MGYYTPDDVGTPGGSDGQVQYNNSGAFGGMEAITTTDGTTLGFHGATPSGQIAAFTITNDLTDRSYDADTVTVAELADVLATLIADLQGKGLIATPAAGLTGQPMGLLLSLTYSS